MKTTQKSSKMLIRKNSNTIYKRLKAKIAYVLTVFFIIILFVNIANADQVCFSPSKSIEDSCQTMIIKELLSAKKSIKIAIFDFTDPVILDHVPIPLRYSPLKVYIVMDKRQAKGKHSLYNDVIAQYNNVKVVSGKRGGLMHNKYIIIDDERVITGSYNFTKGALNKNDENAVLLSDKNIVDQYVEHFNGMYFNGL